MSCAFLITCAVTVLFSAATIGIAVASAWRRWLRTRHHFLCPARVDGRGCQCSIGSRR